MILRICIMPMLLSDPFYGPSRDSSQVINNGACPNPSPRYGMPISLAAVVTTAAEGGFTFAGPLPLSPEERKPERTPAVLVTTPIYEAIEV